jgi:transposase
MSHLLVETVARSLAGDELAFRTLEPLVYDQLRDVAARLQVDQMKRRLATRMVAGCPTGLRRARGAISQRGLAAMDHVGMDLGKKESQIAVLSETGELIERRIRTERDRLLQFFGDRPRSKVLMEASTISEWVARALEEVGHDVVVADPNYAPMYAQRSRRVKTDRRDAVALAQACKLGAYREAHRTSDAQRHVRGMLSVRESLVRMRARCVALVQAILSREGYRVATGSSRCFTARVGRLELPVHLSGEIGPLLAMLSPLNEQIGQLDLELAEIARQDERIGRLMTVPEVGPVTAVAFVATLDAAERFSGPHQVAAYLGLVPREWSSSEKQRRGHITKAGHSRMRWLLVEAAWRVATHRKRAETEALRAWTDRIAQRRGQRVAVVALARKLSGILYAIWRDGTRYESAKVAGDQPGEAKQAA